MLLIINKTEQFFLIFTTLKTYIHEIHVRTKLFKTLLYYFAEDFFTIISQLSAKLIFHHPHCIVPLIFSIYQLKQILGLWFCVIVFIIVVFTVIGEFIHFDFHFRDLFENNNIGNKTLNWF